MELLHWHGDIIHFNFFFLPFSLSLFDVFIFHDRENERQQQKIWRRRRRQASIINSGIAKAIWVWEPGKLPTGNRFFAKAHRFSSPHQLPHIYHSFPFIIFLVQFSVFKMNEKKTCNFLSTKSFFHCNFPCLFPFFFSNSNSFLTVVWSALIERLISFKCSKLKDRQMTF